MLLVQQTAALMHLVLSVIQGVWPSEHLLESYGLPLVSLLGTLHFSVYMLIPSGGQLYLKKGRVFCRRAGATWQTEPCDMGDFLWVKLLFPYVPCHVQTSKEGYYWTGGEEKKRVI